MRIINFIFILLIIIFGITFAILNSASVTLNYYIGQLSTPLSLILVIAFAVGCFVGIVVGIGLFIKMKVANYHLQQRLNLAEKEIKNLRTIPLQDKV